MKGNHRINLPPLLPFPGTSSNINHRLRELLELHFHPEGGSTYWLERQYRLGWQVRDRIRTLEDLWLLGPTPLEDLSRYTYRAFIPQSLYHQRSRLILGETTGDGGVQGSEPRVTAYRDDEFQAAFVNPFLRVAEASGFPRGKPWLWVGPSGPHIAGKVVRELARQTSSMDPFSVDFDLRWAQRLAQHSRKFEGAFGESVYLRHVIEQARHILRREEIRVLVGSPATLMALAKRLRDHEREAIRGVVYYSDSDHDDGRILTPLLMNHFQDVFPHAIHVAGYGNTMSGVVMQIVENPTALPLMNMDYFPLGDRVQFYIVQEGRQEEPTAERGLTWARLCPRNETGRVLFHRLDQSCLLVSVMEHDQAERIAPNAAACALGGRADGFRNPHPSPTSLVAPNLLPVTLA